MFQPPTTLNGYEVKQYRKAAPDLIKVMVHRPGSAHPWVIASWWPELGTTWMWGHYFISYDEARRYFESNSYPREI